MIVLGRMLFLAALGLLWCVTLALVVLGVQ